MRTNYRIWDTKENNYFEPTFEAHRGRLEELLLTPSGELMRRTPEGMEHESAFPDRYIVEFSTGLHAKNGVEIYEGDLLEANKDGEAEEVWFDTERAMFLRRRGDFEIVLHANIQMFEVIGNIHQHAHLLAKKENDER